MIIKFVVVGFFIYFIGWWVVFCCFVQDYIFDGSDNMNIVIFFCDECVFLVLVLLVVGVFFMEFFDGMVIVIVLFDMVRDFGVIVVELNIGISVYLIIFVVLILVSGWIVDCFGVWVIFIFVLVIFIFVLVFCGFFIEVYIFVVMCIFQGVGGVLMVFVGCFVVLCIMLKYQLIKVIVILIWLVLVVFIIGLFLGGFIICYVSWYWIFFINVLLGFVVIIFLLCIIFDICEMEWCFFDFSGFIIILVVMVSLVIVMEWFGDCQLQIWLMLVFVVFGFGCLLYFICYFCWVVVFMVCFDVLQVLMFWVIMYGGLLFWVFISVVFFLFFLLFQVGFGMDFFYFGLLMLVVFVGNLIIKFVIILFICWLGFCWLLLINGVLNVCLLLVCVLFMLQMLVWVIMLIFYFGGVFCLIQFIGVSMLVFVDVFVVQMSDVNMLFSIVLQLVVGLGIMFGVIGICLGEQVGDWLYFIELLGISFCLLFVFIVLICLVGMIDSLYLVKMVGSSVLEKKKQKKK